MVRILFLILLLISFSFSTVPTESTSETTNYSIPVEVFPMIRPIGPKDFDLVPVGIPVDTPKVTSSFGMRFHPVFRIEKMHTGQDFSGELGDTIRATNDGIVENMAIRDGVSTYGIYVKLDHLGTYKTLYAHMEKSLVGIGDTVELGQPIGLMGATGVSSGVHLHYEVIKDGKQINPRNVMRIKGPL